MTWHRFNEYFCYFCLCSSPSCLFIRDYFFTTAPATDRLFFFIFSKEFSWIIIKLRWWWYIEEERGAYGNRKKLVIYFFFSLFLIFFQAHEPPPVLIHHFCFSNENQIILFLMQSELWAHSACRKKGITMMYTHILSR